MKQQLKSLFRPHLSVEQAQSELQLSHLLTYLKPQSPPGCPHSHTLTHMRQTLLSIPKFPSNHDPVLGIPYTDLHTLEHCEPSTLQYKDAYLPPRRPGNAGGTGLLPYWSVPSAARHAGQYHDPRRDGISLFLRLTQERWNHSSLHC